MYTVTNRPSLFLKSMVTKSFSGYAKKFCCTMSPSFALMLTTRLKLPFWVRNARKIRNDSQTSPTAIETAQWMTNSGVGRVQYFVDRAQEYHLLELGSHFFAPIFSFLLFYSFAGSRWDLGKYLLSRPTTSESAKIIIYTIGRGDRNIENGSNIQCRRRISRGPQTICSNML